VSYSLPIFTVSGRLFPTVYQVLVELLVIGPGTEVSPGELFTRSVHPLDQAKCTANLYNTFSKSVSCLRSQVIAHLRAFLPTEFSLCFANIAFSMANQKP
jgi:hypothetical protein